jgi:hypothetical protein
MAILQLRRYQKRDADLDAVAVSGLAGPWTAYTPTITATSGTFTTVSATGRYLVIGKLTCVRVVVSITTNGTAAGSVNASLPNTANGNAVLSGRENNITGKMLQGPISGSTLSILNYDNTYPGGSGYSLIVSGCYENA